LPSSSLLMKPPAAKASNDNLEANSKIIEQTLAEFGIEVKVTEVEQGPVITRYELLPAPGVKLNSISNLSDNLSLALKASSVRMIIPIPGKSAVGIEIPNSVTNMVYLRELVEAQEFAATKNPLPLILGKDTSGRPLISDLSGMPHMLIAGTTGSGKTVSVNAIISGLLFSRTPDELKFVMVDPKMVEMAIYNKIPHMLTPVVTDVRKAAHAINWVVQEMEKRYRLLSTVGVRNIASFNSRTISDADQLQLDIADAKNSENLIPAKLPYIVVVIDELADLMMTMRDKVEGPICRLAQLSRAVGIHLILATQRPSVDVITGVIKANFPARISFKVSSKVDSRTVLDGNGADQLLGKGDLLFLKPGEAKLIRGQAPFVTDEEIRDVVEYWAKQGSPEFLQELTAPVEKKSGDGSGEKDELYEEALKVVAETRVASTSNLQRRMGLGYTRAARIMDQLEAEGVIGPSQGAKAREVYVRNPNASEEAPSSEQA
jgi:DNA segregation ATPase FtsK/SpoIIIE, S-DNA-T family